MAHIINLSGQYQRAGYVILPAFAPSHQVIAFDIATSGLPTRRVQVGGSDVRWDEQTVDQSNPLFDFFAAPSLIDLVGDATGRVLQRPSMLWCWISHYGVGEYIDAHTDSDGSVHVLLCLRADHDHGGALVLRMSDGTDMSHVLKTGDLMIFDATTVEHRTTPLIASDLFPQPVRRIAVARYYF